jgi:transposase
MYIRRTHTNNSASGERYYTYRLIENRRVHGKPRQLTLLNLGKHFAVEQDYWPALCARIDELLRHQAPLFPMDFPASVELEAQRIVTQLQTRQAETVPTSTPASDEANPPEPPRPETETSTNEVSVPTSDIQSVDVDTLELIRPRSVGVEQVGLWAMQQVDFTGLLTEVGLNATQRSAAVGSIIARMAAPGSELASHQWLRTHSALGELLDVDYEAMSLNALYRASDALWKRHKTIEQRLFNRVSDLFGFSTTITLYDLTNTYFEGEVPDNPKAKRGRSKEKRSDCPLVTLGLVLDGSGFVRSSQTFAGNVAEAGTLATMLTALAAPSGALVVMDAGIATEANIAWLSEQGYRYLVVSRERQRQFDAEQAVPVTTAAGNTVHCQTVLDEAAQEVRLYCHSEMRGEKEQAMTQQFSQRFEAELTKIAEGLARPKTEKRIDQLWQRIGRLKAKHHGIGQHYAIELHTNDTGEKAVGLTWERREVTGTMATHPGVYCLRSNETSWDAEKLWHTYIMLTDLEAVFRSLKSELGLRPVYHHKEARVDGHLFITVLAYQLVQVIRRHLREQGIQKSWSALRQTMSTQQRVTASFRRTDDLAMHIRKATRAETEQLIIYRALGCNPAPGGISKTIF